MGRRRGGWARWGPAAGESRAATADEARQMGRLRARVRWGTAVSMLLLTATACMAVWRYV